MQHDIAPFAQDCAEEQGYAFAADVYHDNGRIAIFSI